MVNLYNPKEKRYRIERMKIHYYEIFSIVKFNFKSLIPCCRKCIDWAICLRNASQSHNSFLEFW